MSRGAIRNFIRIRPVSTNSIDSAPPSMGVVDVEHIIAYKRHGWENNLTEVILSNGHAFLSNETVEEFEKRLLKLVPTYHID